MSLLRMVLLALLAAGLSAGVAAEEKAAMSATVKFEIGPLITAGLVDPKAPLERRRELANQLIEAADRSKDPALLYAVGTLYRQGDAAGIAPFPKDIDRAREYLSRAALGGSVMAMGKLAVVELDAGNRFEANLWAQLFVHYDTEFQPARPADPPHAYRRPAGGESVASAILQRTNDGFPKSELPRLLERMKALIARYDSAIRQYRGQLDAENQRNRPQAVAGKAPFFLTPMQLGKVLGPKAASAVAEYFVEFAPGGELARAWPFDGWPEKKVLRVLRPIVNGLESSSAAAGTANGRVVLIPVTFVNTSYRLKQRGGAD